MEVSSRAELLNFVNQAGFPSHGLVLRSSKDDTKDCIKGIVSVGELFSVFERMLQSQGKVWVETDMRAMYNPTRMTVIEKAAQRLIAAIESQCPQCATPGYGIKKALRGLPCGQCGFPTQSTLSHVYQCKHCGYHDTKQFPAKKTTEDPTYCDYCNP